MSLEASWVTKATSPPAAALFSFPIVVTWTQLSVQTEDLPANVMRATQNQRLHVEAHKEEAPESS